MAGKTGSQTRYFCKACKLWIADNRAQREQHNRGSKHRAAVNAQLADIARRNAEKARADAENRARVAAIEALAGPPVQMLRSVPAIPPTTTNERADLLERVASATTAKNLVVGVAARFESESIYDGTYDKYCARGQVPFTPGTNVVCAKMDRNCNQSAPTENVRDSRGYGLWEEVVDVENTVSQSDDETLRTSRVESNEMRIGAKDEADDEEARARESLASSVCSVPSGTDGCIGPQAIIFKSRSRATGNKRRKR